MLAGMQSNRNSHSLPVGMQSWVATLEDSVVSYKDKQKCHMIEQLVSY